ncbi:MAG: sodium:calcium antiporter [Naasia sp.]|nr:sodium:calcium antiporter [Naasia sp.]
MHLQCSGSGMAGQIGPSGELFGATILALATSLPEISTGLASVRQGDHKLAVNDISGGNAFLPVLFLVATPSSGKDALPGAQSTGIRLTGIGILSTLVSSLGISSGRSGASSAWGSRCSCCTPTDWSACSRSRSPRAEPRNAPVRPTCNRARLHLGRSVAVVGRRRSGPASDAPVKG